MHPGFSKLAYEMHETKVSPQSHLIPSVLDHVEEDQRVMTIVIAQKPVGADHDNGANQFACRAIASIIDLAQGLQGVTSVGRGETVRLVQAQHQG